MKYIYLLILLLGVGCYPSYGQNQTEEGRVIKQLELYKTELANTAEANRLELKKQVDQQVIEVKASSAWIETLAYIFGIISVGSLIGGILFLRNRMIGFGKAYLEGYVADKYPNMVRGELKRILEDENEALDQAIAAKTLESRLRKKFPIRVLVVDEEDLKQARQEISVIHEYENVTYQKVDEYSGNDKHDELVVFFSLNGRMVGKTKGEKDDIVERILADELTRWKKGELKNIFVLATNEQWDPLFSKDFRKICNSGQSPYVLDARMMESLTYLYKRNKNLKP